MEKGLGGSEMLKRDSQTNWSRACQKKKSLPAHLINSCPLNQSAPANEPPFLDLGGGGIIKKKKKKKKRMMTH